MTEDRFDAERDPLDELMPDNASDPDQQPDLDTERAPEAPPAELSPAPPPASAAPPRIVAEAPLGGVPRSIAAPESRFFPRSAPASEVSADEPLTPDALAPDQLAVSPIAAAPAEAEGVETPRVGAAEAVPEAPIAASPPAETPSDTSADDTTILLASRALEPEAVSEAAPVTPAMAEPESALLAASAEPPAAPMSSTPAPIAAASDELPLDTADWDEELSPELAAVLFGAAKAAPAAPEAPAAEPAPDVEAAPVTTTRAVPVSAGPTAPILLTDISDARRLPIFAEGHIAPAPDAPLEGLVRYVRIEEPHRRGQGKRIRETWDFQKPDLPALNGRLVRRVRSEQIQHADGSWEWHYERHYSDRGRDRRSVRANADRTLILRNDEVSTLDPETGRRLRFREAAALIFAAPPRAERRGWLSRLLRRSANDAIPGAPEWRPATPAEINAARQQGGAAL